MANKEAEAVEVSEVSKITPALLGKPSRAKIEDKEVAIARVYGVANGIKIVKALTGDVFEALRGNFEGVSLETGEIFTSGILYLPAGIHDRIIGQLKELDGNGSIQFGIELSAIPAKNPAGYSWKATNVVKQDVADPLAALRGQAQAGMKLLPPKAKK
jgi:hypothetical protein